MYIDSINKNNNNNCLSAFGNVLICSNAIDADKTITFPIGYSVEDDLNLSFKILFVNGHNCIDDSTHMTLSDGSNAYPIVVNKDGTLIPLPIHTMTESSTTVYKSLQPNTILEMYYDSNYGTDGAFVIIGNPIVLSSDTYTIYANGKVGDGNVGDIKAISLVNIPSYGWLECNGQSVLRTDYPLLFNYFNTQCYDDDPTHTLLEQYGYVDSNHFNLPDYQEVALVGVGTNVIDKAKGTLATSDIYTVGQFKDDAYKTHAHDLNFGNTHWSDVAGSWEIGDCLKAMQFSGSVGYRKIKGFPNSTDNSDNNSAVTRGKSKGVKYIIKVL